MKKISFMAQRVKRTFCGWLLADVSRLCYTRESS